MKNTLVRVLCACTVLVGTYGTSGGIRPFSSDVETRGISGGRPFSVNGEGINTFGASGSGGRPF